MTKYSPEQIRKAIKAFHTCGSLRKAQAQTGIPKSTIHVWVNQLGHRFVDKRKGRKNNRKCIYPKELIDMVKKLLEKQTTPIISVHQAVRAKFGNSMSTTRRAIQKLGLTRKKVSEILVPKTPEQIEKIKEFRQKIITVPIDDIISVDESSFDSRMLSTHGYSKKGERIMHAETLKTRNRHSLCCGVSVDGIETQYIVEGSMNTEEFKKHLLNFLPHCKQNVILLDNIRFHHNKDVLKIIADHGKEVIFVPPYSPQYNPIEHAFSSMKKTFRDMQEEETELIPLSIERLDDFVDAYKACKQPNDWRKTFEHCLRTCVETKLPDGTD